MGCEGVLGVCVFREGVPWLMGGLVGDVGKGIFVVAFGRSMIEDEVEVRRKCWGERNTGDTGGWRLKGDGRLGVVAEVSHMGGM